MRRHKYILFPCIGSYSLYTGKELNKFYPIVYGKDIAASDANEVSAKVKYVATC
jgi:hypothetical protein